APAPRLADRRRPVRRGWGLRPFRVERWAACLSSWAAPTVVAGRGGRSAEDRPSCLACAASLPGCSVGAPYKGCGRAYRSSCTRFEHRQRWQPTLWPSEKYITCGLPLHGSRSSGSSLLKTSTAGFGWTSGTSLHAKLEALDQLTVGCQHVNAPTAGRIHRKVLFA